MAPNNCSPGLPSISDIVLGENARLSPEIEEVISSTGETIAAFDEEESRPTRSHSTGTWNSHRPRRSVQPSRFPSTSSSGSQTIYTALPMSPRQYDVTCQVQPLQLPSSQKTVYESWTITYHHPAPRPPVQARILGVTLFRFSGCPSDATATEAGSILSVVPNTHFSQDELAETVVTHQAAVVARLARHNKKSGGQGRRWLSWWPKSSTNTHATTTLCKPRPVGSGAASRRRSSSGGCGGNSCCYFDNNGHATPDCGSGNGSGAVATGSDAMMYAADLEARIRRLDWKVQDEIYELLGDRMQSSSNAFRRRDWRVVVLSEVPGGELTDQPTGFGAFDEREKGWKRGGGMGDGRPHNLPVTEYRLILRGTETRANDQGWGYYNRYSRPWRDADEKELGQRRRWSTLTGKNEKYVDF